MSIRLTTAGVESGTPLHGAGMAICDNPDVMDRVWQGLVDVVSRYDPAIREHLRHWVQEELDRLPREAGQAYLRAPSGRAVLEAEEQAALSAILQSLKKTLCEDARRQMLRS